MRISALYISLIVIFLSGCNSFKDPKRGAPEYAPSYPEAITVGKNNNNSGAIYHAQNSLQLFETPRARRVGDILTVLLMEQTRAEKNAENRSEKKEEGTITNPTLFSNPLAVGIGDRSYGLGFGTDANRKFNGRADSRQRNQLTGNISVTVHKVYSNGNMQIRGEKWIVINQGKEYIRLTGLVRPQDISPDNTVTSDKVANANIAYSGTGQDHDANKRGWLSKFLWSSIFPFQRQDVNEKD